VTTIATVPEPAPPISVVVPTRDRPGLLDECLRALRRALAEGDEVIVVDSASRDPAVGRVAEAHGARLLRAGRPGASVARNLGWRAARHELVAFVDDDIRVSLGWADAARRAFLRDPDLAFVTGRVEAPPEQAGVHYANVALVLHPEPEELVAGSARPRGISGNVVVRRFALERVGGFDEMLGAGQRFRAAEDTDLFDRILAAGLRGRYDPALLASHDQWRTRGERLRLDWSYGVGAGARLAKILRRDRRQARLVAGEFLWRWGVLDLARSLRSRYKFGAAAAAIRLVGMVAGLVAAFAHPVRDGRFAPRRPARR
jgi:glycosyltransferase involved in cell wall biosynthesis